LTVSPTPTPTSDFRLLDRLARAFALQPIHHLLQRVLHAGASRGPLELVLVELEVWQLVSPG
jgi:hypothetical protein